MGGLVVSDDHVGLTLGPYACLTAAHKADAYFVQPDMVPVAFVEEVAYMIDASGRVFGFDLDEGRRARDLAAVLGVPEVVETSDADESFFSDGKIWICEGTGITSVVGVDETRWRSVAE